MSKKLLYSLLILLACFTAPLAATEYYVDSHNGSDDAAGTSENLAWRSLAKVNAADLKPGDVVRFVRGGLWRGTLKPKSGTSDMPVTYTSYGSSDQPKPQFYGSLPLNRPDDWVRVETQLWRTAEPVTEALPETLSDVGNLIFDGNRAGIKQWSKEQLKTDGMFWFDPETRCVWLVCENNPAETHREIEAALRRNHVIDLTRVHHAVFSDFDVRYGAAHGFGGADNSHMTIRDCDISWVGGGHQFTRPDGMPVRYGNGIEFWDNAHDHLVEGCRIWEIYDAALTNQGGAKNEQRNIIYRNNIMWNCEYSFEYWNRPAVSITDNIVFTHNICLNAGFGWGHSQRPDPNGRHLSFWASTSATTNVVITHNLFAYATESIIMNLGPRGQQGNAWLKQDVLMDNNIWLQHSGSSLVLWQNEDIYDFRVYQEKTGLDRNSVFTLDAKNKAATP